MTIRIDVVKHAPTGEQVSAMEFVMSNFLTENGEINPKIKECMESAIYFINDNNEYGIIVTAREEG